VRGLSVDVREDLRLEMKSKATVRTNEKRVEVGPALERLAAVLRDDALCHERLSIFEMR
jgi:hypothetical protein